MVNILYILGKKKVRKVNMKESVRNRIEERLKAMKMSQRDLAEKLNVSEVTVSRWLSGERNPSLETMNSIASALDTTPAYLLSENAELPQENKPEQKSGDVNLGAILAETALTATAVIGIVALAKALGKLTDKDKEQIEDILER